MLLVTIINSPAFQNLLSFFDVLQKSVGENPLSFSSIDNAPLFFMISKANISVISHSRKSFSSADIRVSSNIKSPNAENPNLCGLPGDYIELPSSFFDAANSGEYGVNCKSQNW